MDNIRFGAFGALSARYNYLDQEPNQKFDVRNYRITGVEVEADAKNVASVKFYAVPYPSNFKQTPRMGGNDGIVMNFKNNKNLVLIGARGSYTWWLDQIQFKFLDVNTGRIVWTPTCGNGSGNNKWSYEAPGDSWVSSIWLKTGQYVDKIKFGLNRGRESNYFGGTEGPQLHHQ